MNIGRATRTSEFWSQKSNPTHQGSMSIKTRKPRHGSGSNARVSAPVTSEQGHDSLGRFTETTKQESDLVLDGPPVSPEEEEVLRAYFDNDETWPGDTGAYRFPDDEITYRFLSDHCLGQHRSRSNETGWGTNDHEAVRVTATDAGDPSVTQTVEMSFGDYLDAKIPEKIAGSQNTDLHVSFDMAKAYAETLDGRLAESRLTAEVRMAVEDLEDREREMDYERMHGRDF